MMTLPGGWGAFNGPPLKSLQMKLRRHVRSQNRGPGGFPVHLDFFQAANMCISQVFTSF